MVFCAQARWTCGLQAGFHREQQLSWDDGLGRSQAVVGKQWLMPYEIELEAALFAGRNGDVSRRATLAQDFLLTHRLILQPRLEINAVVQSAAPVPFRCRRIGRRLRCEILREVASYAGVSWPKTSARPLIRGVQPTGTPAYPTRGSEHYAWRFPNLHQ